jgi:hypothetical protein
MPRITHSGTAEKKLTPKLKAKLSAFIKRKEILGSAADALKAFDKEVEAFEATVKELSRYNPSLGEGGPNLRVYKRWRLTADSFLKAAKQIRAELAKFVMLDEKKTDEETNGNGT